MTCGDVHETRNGPDPEGTGPFRAGDQNWSMASFSVAEGRMTAAVLAASER